MFSKIEDKPAFIIGISYFLFAFIFLHFIFNITAIICICGFLLSIILLYIAEILFKWTCYLKYASEKDKLKNNNTIRLIVIFFINILLLLLVNYIKINNKLLPENFFPNFLLSTLGLFGTLLALYWTIVATIFSIRYNNASNKIQKFYFKSTSIFKISLCTLIYFLFTITIYFINTLYTCNENLILRYISIIISIAFSFYLLYMYIFNSLECINLSNIYYLYKVIQLYITKSLNICHKKIITKEEIILIRDSAVEFITIIHSIIKNDIIKNNINNETILDYLSINIEILNDYWKIKNKFLFNNEWYIKNEQQNSHADTIITGDNIIYYNNNFFLEQLIFNYNNEMSHILIKQNDFSSLNNYLIKLKELVILSNYRNENEQDNLLYYNIPSFYETLYASYMRINQLYNIIKNKFIINQNNKDFFSCITSLHSIIGNIFITNQKFLQCFSENNINSILPSYTQFFQYNTVEDLLINYPILNNQTCFEKYIKIFIEKKIEKNISKKSYDEVLSFQKEIINQNLSYSLFFINSIYDNLLKEMKFFYEQENKHYFFNAFDYFLQLKYEVVINNRYDNIYQQTGLDKTTLTNLFSLPENYKEYIISAMKFYTDPANNCFDYPNLLSHLYLVIINILIQSIRLDSSETKKLINTIYQLTLAVQEIIYGEKDNNDKQIIANSRVLILLSSVLGSYLILSQKNFNYIKKEVLIENFQYLIKNIQYKNTLQSSLNILNSIINSGMLQNYKVDIFNIETKLSTKDIQVHNSVQTFAKFLDDLLKGTM